MFICEKNFSCCSHKYWDRWEDVEQDAKECGHLIEVAPMRYGRWEWNGNHWECTNCRGNRFHDLVLGLDAAYCGYCGAKMIEEDK